MQDGQALGIVEAAYDLCSTPRDAMQVIARAMRAVACGPVAVAYYDEQARLDHESVHYECIDENYISCFFDWQRSVTPGSRELAFSLAPRVMDFYSDEHAQARGVLEAMTHPLFPICVMANTGCSDSLCIYTSLCAREWLPAQLHQFHDVAHHLAAAWRLRKALEHPAATAREVLRRAVHGHERSATASPCSLWEALLAGQWSLLDTFTSGGTRYVVACKNPDRDATLRAVPLRERAVLELTLAGRSGKWIAFELQLSQSTVARSLRMALRRLGVNDQAALAGLRTAAFEPFDVGGATLALTRLAPAEASGELSDAERSVVSCILGGKRVAAIAHERGTSPRTVANQLASAYRKLGVSSRREVIALLA